MKSAMVLRKSWEMRPHLVMSHQMIFEGALLPRFILVWNCRRANVAKDV